MLQNLQNFAKFQKIQLDNLVDFEKCCKTRIFLQKSVPIQPKTNNMLPKFCQNSEIVVAGRDGDGDVQGRLGGRRGLVEVAARDVEDVAGGELGLEVGVLDQRHRCTYVSRG